MMNKKRRKGTKMGSNASEDPLNFRGWVGADGVQLLTRVGPTKFHHFKTHNFENHGGGGGGGGSGPRSPLWIRA